MVTLATRIDEIYQVEGFKVRVKDAKGRRIAPNEHGVLEAYQATRALTKTKLLAIGSDFGFARSGPT